MLVPLSWLKDYVDINVDPDTLEEKLFSCGFEVEEKYEVGKDISNVVVWGSWTSVASSVLKHGPGSFLLW